MSLFADSFAARQGALDGAFGEALTIAPQASGEFTSGGDDPNNAAFTAIGILDVEGVVVDDSGVKTGARSEVETVKPQADFALSQFGAGRMQPIKGTKIVAATRPGAPSYVVLDGLPDGIGRIVFQLAPLP